MSKNNDKKDSKAQVDSFIDNELDVMGPGEIPTEAK